MESCSAQSPNGAQHIILVGLMGCGKTTVGRELSKSTGRAFLDMDALIEEQIGKSIAEIFADEGEAHFRSLETALLRYMLEEPFEASGNCIISTGGGVVLRPENRELLQQLGFVIWLDVEVPILLERTSRCTHRPLLQGDEAFATLSRLYEQRYDLYRQAAHLCINASDKTVDELVLVVEEATQAFFKQD